MEMQLEERADEHVGMLEFGWSSFRYKLYIATSLRT
jgi:hypothetical protein